MRRKKGREGGKSNDRKEGLEGRIGRKEGRGVQEEKKKGFERKEVKGRKERRKR